MKMCLHAARMCLFAVALVSTTALEAVNRFRVLNEALALGSTSNVVTVLADLDQDVLGFSVSIDFDRTKIRIRDVELGEDVVALAPDFSNGRIDEAGGNLVHGVVFALEAATLDTRLESGEARELLRLIVDVVAESSTSTVINLRNVSGNPSRLNVLTDTSGRSVTPSPTLVDGILTLASNAPDIQDIQFNRGLPGAEFFVVGQNFGLPGLTVTVCGNVAESELLVDQQTLRVIAPSCPTTGFAEVELCNDFGCDSRANGFDYEEPPDQAPDIQDIQFNRGRAGDHFFVVGQNFDLPNLVLTACGVVVEYELLVDGQTLDALAPSCPDEGWAVVEVCNDFGCDSVAQGFFYEESDVGTAFLRGDANNDTNIDLSDGVAILNDLFIGVAAAAPCDDALDANDSGSVDLSDGVFLLNYLFQGGGPPPPPFPDAGLDPTQDSLADC